MWRSPNTLPLGSIVNFPWHNVQMRIRRPYSQTGDLLSSSVSRAVGSFTSTQFMILGLGCNKSFYILPKNKYLNVYMHVKYYDIDLYIVFIIAVEPQLNLNIR